MTTMEYTQLVVSTVAIGLVVLVFGFAAPWYRTWAGWVLFGVKVSLFLILLILALNEKDLAPRFVFVLNMIVFPLTTITSCSLLILMILTQVSRFSEHTAELLFRKTEHPHEVWDGEERRHIPDDSLEPQDAQE